MAKADDVAAQVVATIVSQIEAGAGEWKMPWRGWSRFGMPVNGVSHRQYSGGNVIALWIAQIEKGYELAEWATYQQWQEAGGQVRKGEKATHVMFWKQLERTETNDDGDDVTKRFGMMRTYPVFNVAQVDGIVQPGEIVVDGPDIGERIMHFLQPIPFQQMLGSPAYLPEPDLIRMPPTSAFDDGDDWFSTIAHELAHWTGHESRLARTYGKRFGDDAYAMEELVAELSSAFTCSLFDIVPGERKDHAQYLGSWCRRLKADPQILWSVASKAMAATNHLLAYSGQDDEDGDRT